jgi:hypothetical protein
MRASLMRASFIILSFKRNNSLKSEIMASTSNTQPPTFTRNNYELWSLTMKVWSICM